MNKMSDTNYQFVEKDIFEANVGCTCAGCCTIMKISHYYWEDGEDRDYYLTFYLRHPDRIKWGIFNKIKTIFLLLFGRDRLLSELILDKADIEVLIDGLRKSLGNLKQQ